MAKLFVNSGDPEQTPHSAASDLGLHCLPITLLGVSRLHWVKETKGNKVSPYFGSAKFFQKLFLLKKQTFQVS